MMGSLARPGDADPGRTRSNEGRQFELVFFTCRGMPSTGASVRILSFSAPLCASATSVLKMKLWGYLEGSTNFLREMATTKTRSARRKTRNGLNLFVSSCLRGGLIRRCQAHSHAFRVGPGPMRDRVETK